jgi:hypothetical protein
MYYQEDVRTLDHANRLPSRFALNFALKVRNMAGVVENQRGGFKTETMLPLVDTILSLVPAKLQLALRYDNYVYTSDKSPVFPGQPVYTALRTRKGLS